MYSNLTTATLNQEYEIKDIIANDEELIQFLFSLGCYEGEKITVVSKLNENYVVSIKDARYSVGKELALAIIV